MVLSQLLWDHLTVDSSSSRVANSRKAACTRPITGLDAWLEAWSIYAGVRSQVAMSSGSVSDHFNEELDDNFNRKCASY